MIQFVTATALPLSQEAVVNVSSTGTDYETIARFRTAARPYTQRRFTNVTSPALVRDPLVVGTTTTTTGSLVLGGHVYPGILGEFMSTQYIWSLPRFRRSYRQSVTSERPSGLAEIEADSATLSLRAPSRNLAQKVRSVFTLAPEERFEDGMDSDFSRTLVSLIEMYGGLAVAELSQYLTTEVPNEEVVGEALRWIGAIDHPESHQERSFLLQKALQSSGARIRYAAALGLSRMDDPSAIPALRAAIGGERHEKLRRYFQRVLDQLEQTRRWRNTLE